jgi:hypothetical protein
MKPLSIFLLMLGFPTALSAQDDASPQMETVSEETGIQGAIADGTPAPPLPEKPPIPFNVLSSATKRVEVSESPELPGLPAPQGTINMTMQLVEDPGLPPVERPLPPQVDVNDPAVQEQIREAREKFKETKILLISASVYGGTKTLLKVYPNGVGQGEVTVISNLDFNDFSGFSTWQVKDVDTEGGEEIRQYANIMALGNSDSGELSRIASDHGLEVDAVPDAPPGNEPSFIVIEGDHADALQAVADLHALYRAEGAKMRTARISRERAYEERKAYLLANPPRPKDVTFRFWKKAASNP